MAAHLLREGLHKQADRGSVLKSGDSLNAELSVRIRLDRFILTKVKARSPKRCQSCAAINQMAVHKGLLAYMRRHKDVAG